MSIDKFRYDGKRVLVCGAASGMGEATARILADLGAEIYALDVKEMSLPAKKTIQMDLRDRASIDGALAEVGGPIHALFSCAGVAGAPFSPLDVMLINFVGARHLIESAAESKMPPGSAIAFISSIGGLGWETKLETIMDLLATDDFEAGRTWVEEKVATGPKLDEEPAFANYAFSKQVTGVYCMWRSHAFSQKGIRINATAPGPTKTPLMEATPGWQGFMGGEFKEKTGRDGSTAEEQGYALVFLNSDAASSISGHVLTVDAGYAGGALTNAFPSMMLAGLRQQPS